MELTAKVRINADELQEILQDIETVKEKLRKCYTKLELLGMLEVSETEQYPELNEKKEASDEE